MNQFFGVIGVFALIVLAVMATIITCGIIRGFILRRRMNKEIEVISKKGDHNNGSSAE